MKWLARHHRPPQTNHANDQPVVWRQLIFKQGGCNKIQFDLSVKCHRSKRLAMQRTEVLTLNFKLARTFNNAVPTISWQGFVSAWTETHRRENVIDLASNSLKPFMKIHKNLKENVGLPLLQLHSNWENSCIDIRVNEGYIKMTFRWQFCWLLKLTRQLTFCCLESFSRWLLTHID